VDDWQIQDPKGKSIGEVREIRDQIEQKVKDFIVSITKEGSI
jgi:protein-tyrosine-phosphatase